MKKTPYSVLVVDDSAYHRRTIERIVNSDPRFSVLGTAVDGEDAIKKVVNLDPDLLTLDLEMPRMDGFTFLKWLMKSHPRPVLVVTSRESNKSVFKALDLGAVDFVVKPVKYASIKLEAVEGELLDKLLQVASIKVEALPAKLSAMAEKPPPAVVSKVGAGTYRLVSIGASTGGPPALQSILSRLPRGLPVGFVISQHMPEGFTKLFAERLNRQVGIRVKEARDGDAIENGKALVAPGGRHLLLEKGKGGAVIAKLKRAGPADRYVPSIDEMMSSAADIYGKHMIGVLLTGMGDDGVKGMKLVKNGGGLTLAESEETCIVYGMPREAARQKAAEQILPLSEICETIIRESQGGQS